MIIVDTRIQVMLGDGGVQVVRALESGGAGSALGFGPMDPNATQKPSIENSQVCIIFKDLAALVNFQDEVDLLVALAKAST